MKKIAFITAIALTFTLVSYGAGAENLNKRSMTLEDAIEYAEEHSYSLKNLSTEVEKAQMTYSTEMRNKRSYNNEMSGASFTVDTGFAATLYKNGYILDTAKMSLNIAERNYEAGVNDLKNNVRQSFYEYLINKNKTENCERNLEHAKELKGFADIKYDSGQITKLDLQNFELNVAEAEYKLQAQRRTEDLKLDLLKNVMCYSGEEELVPVGKVVLCEMDSTSLDTALEKAEEHTSMKNNEEVYQNAKKRLQLAKTWYSSAQIDYYQEKAEFAKAENTYYNNKNSILIGVKSAYNTMLSMYDNIKLLNSRTDYVKAAADVAKLRYDMGQITSSDYISTVNQIYELETSVDEMILNAVNSVYNYRATFTYSN